ncbi:MAG: methionyl-tRNA formyltransferase [Nitrospirae bacterium]|nr:methionyl-tRNA formyltransferase [Nitrospirota bacterium]
MGTPEFSVPSLEAIVGADPVQGCHEVLAVITQPESRRKRRGRHEPSPVKLAAQKANLHVIEPENIRQHDVIETIRQLRPDAAVVVAYGELLPRGLLAIPEKGCINIHPSLLPRYRGAAPIQWAIINGDTITGVCTMLLDEGLDTGPVFLSVEEPIHEDDTAATLGKRLSNIGANLLLLTLRAIEHDGLTPHGQKGVPSTARPLKKKDGHINWQLPARDIVNLIRGLQPWPGAYTSFNGQRVKILKASVVSEESVSGAATVVRQDDEGLVVATGSGLLSLDVIQPEGKNPMQASAFIRGRVRGKEITLHVD